MCLILSVTPLAAIHLICVSEMRYHRVLVGFERFVRCALQ